MDEMRKNETPRSQRNRDQDIEDSGLQGQPPAEGTEAENEAVRRRAYDIYQSRGGAPGSEVDDWIAAEREVRTGRDGNLQRDERGEADDEER